MMTVMVPDLVPPTEDIRSLCIAIAADLHGVRELLLNGGVEPVTAPRARAN